MKCSKRGGVDYDYDGLALLLKRIICDAAPRASALNQKRGQPVEGKVDSDGYPDDDDLTQIREWDAIHDSRGLIDFVESIWWMPDWGFSFDSGKLELHTGGWSGNESIIAALMENKKLFWTMYWQSSRRGGHYYFDDEMVGEGLKWH